MEISSVNPVCFRFLSGRVKRILRLIKEPKTTNVLKISLLLYGKNKENIVYKKIKKDNINCVKDDHRKNI